MCFFNLLFSDPLLSFSQSSQVDSHDSTFPLLTSMPDFSTAAGNLWTLGFSLGQDLRGGCSPPPFSVRLSTALRGLPNLCFSSSDTIYHNCKFSVIKTFDFQTGPEYEPRGQLLADRQGWRASGLLDLPLSPLPGSLWPQQQSFKPWHHRSSLMRKSQKAGLDTRGHPEGEGLWPEGE